MITDLPASAPEDVMVTVDDVHKRFGATYALRGVSCAFRRGEFVALLGSNGAGKSTLIKILDGVHVADSGVLAVRGGRHGLGVVHQDLGLVDSMTVTQNMFLGERRRLVNPRVDAGRAVAALREVGLERVSPHALVSSLSLGERAMIAVARTLDRGAETVVVDEVTAGLHPREARWVVEKLQVAAARGATVLMVTHKLDEVIGIASRYLVLSDGTVALDETSHDMDRPRLVEIMSRGRTFAVESTRETADPGEEVCTLSQVHAGAAGPVSLGIRRGEITAVTGPLGSGVHELAYVAAGLERPDAGEVTLASTTRVACVPAHRESEGLFPEGSVQFNATAGGWRRWTTRSGLLAVRRMRRDTDDAVAELNVVPHRLDATVSQLSGGNQQKTLLVRATMRRPELLVLCEPTRGVDVATRREIYAQIRHLASQGVAVLLASTDPEDVAALADRIGVLGPDGLLSDWMGPDDLALLAAELA
jgi:ABC-type sugar transport system ATPase subunit